MEKEKIDELKAICANLDHAAVFMFNQLLAIEGIIDSKAGVSELTELEEHVFGIIQATLAKCRGNVDLINALEKNKN
jgi:hypothetical protein